MRSIELIVAQSLAFLLSTSLCMAQKTNAPYLTSESIANQALAVATATKSNGHCYAAVTRALSPLGVKLSGGSAYMAAPLLLQDPRFIPLSISSIEQLRRGDIIVYSASNAHPHGHISVYEGDYLEASDHVSKVTHTKAYGGATVFRLRGEPLEPEPIIAIAPDFRSASRQSTFPSSSQDPEILTPSPKESKHDAGAGLWPNVKRRFNNIAKSPGTSSLSRRFVRFLIRSL